MYADTIWQYVQTTLKAKLIKKYSNLSVTASDKNDKPPSLPNLFVNQIDAQQTGNDLEMNRQNALISVIQLETSSSVSPTEARRIMNDAINVMVEKHYVVMSGPLQQNTSVYRMVARFSRVIANNDSF